MRMLFTYVRTFSDINIRSTIKKGQRHTSDPVAGQYFVVFIVKPPLILLQFAVVYCYRSSALPHLKIRADMLSKF